MTKEAQDAAARERKEVVAFLREGGPMVRFTNMPLLDRLMLAWRAFRHPWPLQRAVCMTAADYIEADEHIEGDA